MFLEVGTIVIVLILKRGETHNHCLQYFFIPATHEQALCVLRHCQWMVSRKKGLAQTGRTIKLDFAYDFDI